MSPFEVRLIESNEIDLFIQLIGVFEDVFEMEQFVMPAKGHLENLLRDPGFKVFIALDSDKRVIGGLTTYTLSQYYKTSPLAYIYDLAVDRGFQRMGIGKRLIETTTGYFRGLGFEEVFVQAEGIDVEVIEFYRSTQPNGEDAVAHFHYTL